MTDINKLYKNISCAGCYDAIGGCIKAQTISDQETINLLRKTIRYINLEKIKCCYE